MALCLLPPSASGPAPELALAGCEQLNRGAVCVLGAQRELRVWLATSNRARRLALHDGVWRALAGEPAAGGTLYRLTLPTASLPAQLRLRTQAAHATSPSVERTLQLVAAPRWAWQSQLERRDNQQAQRLLLQRLGSARGTERASLLYELARREYRLGAREQGAEHLQQAASLAERRGLLSLARNSYCLLANHATTAHEFATSRRALAAAEQLPAPARGLTDAYGQALLGNARGVFAAELAALPAAAAAYAQANVWVLRGAAQMWQHVTSGLAAVSVMQGRLLRAHQLYTGLLHSEQAAASRCFRALTLSNLGWLELELLRAGAGPADAGTMATAHLRAAVDCYERCSAAAGWRLAHARLSLAYDALRRGALAEARAGIERAGGFEAEPRLAQYRQLLIAELALAEGRPEAASQQYAQLESQLQREPNAELQWRALEGHGRALVAQLRYNDAIASFEHAERVLTRAARDVPEAGALTSFLGTHDHSARGLRAAYLAIGRTDLAFRALRRAQRRQLLALAHNERMWKHATAQAWQRRYAAVLEARDALAHTQRRAELAPEDEAAARRVDVAQRRSALAAAQRALLQLMGHDALDDDARLRQPAAGELMLAWVRSERGYDGYAWLGSAGTARHAHFADAPHDATSLAPFSDLIAAARQISVLSWSEPSALDVHALTFHGEALIAHAPVSYSLDLPPRAAKANRTRSALVAHEAHADLAYAQREQAELQQALAAGGWRVRPLERPDALVSATRSPGLLYYAGHGSLDTQDSMRSALAFTDSTLSVADILALRAAPQRVVLSACEAARVPDLAQGQGVGLAHAFILAGSSEVLAPARPVRDRDAAAFAARIRAGLVQDVELGALYRTALVQGKGAGFDFAAYRRIVP